MKRMYVYIETSVYWGDGFTASMLGQIFGLARPNAQKVVAKYRQQYPNNIQYNASKRRQIAHQEFSPHHISTQANRYLDYVRGVSAISYYSDSDDIDWNEVDFFDVDQQLKPPLNKHSVQQVLSAIQNKQTLLIRYQSKFSYSLREISPHRLVHASHRYHIRAYCHLYHKYFDFVLSRMSEVTLSNTDWVSGDGDQAWNECINLRFQINPQLPSKVRQALQSDYLLGDSDIRRIKTQYAKLAYIRREMERIDWKYQCRLWVEI